MWLCQLLLKVKNVLYLEIAFPIQFYFDINVSNCITFMSVFLHGTLSIYCNCLFVFLFWDFK